MRAHVKDQMLAGLRPAQEVQPAAAQQVLLSQWVPPSKQVAVEVQVAEVARMAVEEVVQVVRTETARQLQALPSLMSVGMEMLAPAEAEDFLGMAILGRNTTLRMVRVVVAEAERALLDLMVGSMEPVVVADRAMVMLAAMVRPE